MKVTRPYVMRARADAAAASRQRILEAAGAAMRRQFRPDVRLDEIAHAAGVSVGTVLRIFGSRQLLLDEVAAAALRDVEAEFADVSPGDLRGVVRAYFNHYEKVGDLVVRNIVDEGDPEMHRFVEHGRRAHRAGVETRLGPALAGTSGVSRRRAVDALVCALDVYTWKLLRRDIGRSRVDAEATVHQMVVAIVGGLS